MFKRINNTCNGNKRRHMIEQQTSMLDSPMQSTPKKDRLYARVHTPNGKTIWNNQSNLPPPRNIFFYRNIAQWYLRDCDPMITDKMPSHNDTKNKATTAIIIQISIEGLRNKLTEGPMVDDEVKKKVKMCVKDNSGKNRDRSSIECAGSFKWRT